VEEADRAFRMDLEGWTKSGGQLLFHNSYVDELLMPWPQVIEARMAAPDYLKSPPGHKSPHEEFSSSSGSNLIKLTKNMLQLS
jgi:hypothetical protein